MYPLRLPGPRSLGAEPPEAPGLRHARVTLRDFSRTLPLVPLDMTDEQRAAVIELLTQDPLDPNDLISAIKRAMQRRAANSRNGGLAIEAALHNGFSWRGLEAETGIPESTLRGWIKPPKGRRP